LGDIPCSFGDWASLRASWISLPVAAVYMFLSSHPGQYYFNAFLPLKALRYYCSGAVLGAALEAMLRVTHAAMVDPG